MAPKILIVDDEVLVCDALIQLVELAGYQAFHASDGKEALRLILECHPDLVVTDLLMPEKDGIELITELRQIGQTTKIIGISGGSPNIAKEGQLKVASLMGADLCMAKPLDARAFIGSVNKLLQ